MTKIPVLEYSSLKKAYAFEFNGMKLHELYFDNLDKTSILDTQSPFYKKIIEDFGSFEMWKKDFIQTGLSRGIGWVMCFYDAEGKRLLNTWIESHDKGVPIFDNIVLIMDCWEHAYLQDFGISRIDYINTFLKHIRWPTVINRFNKIQSD
jgi:Fe-Mn family superoxide dismutase